MSAPIDIRQFQNNVVKLEPHDVRLAEVWLRLGMSAMLPPKIRNARTANAADIGIRKDRFLRMHAAYIDFCSDMLNELNENLPLTETIVTADFFAGQQDLRSDMEWAFDKAMERE